MHILLVNDTTDWCHWGCTGTSAMLKEGLTRGGNTLDVYPARLTYQAGWGGRPSTLAHFDEERAFNQFCEKNSSLVDKIRLAEAIIINGEGTLHGIKDPALNLLYLAYIGKRFFNKHVEIINHSVFPEDALTLENKGTQLLYQTVYKQLDFIAVREPLSLDILKQLGISARLSFDCLPLYIKANYQSNRVHAAHQNIVLAGSAAWQGDYQAAIVDYIHWMHHQGFKITVLIGAKEYYKSDSKLVDFLDDDKILAFFKEHLKSLDWQLIKANSMTQWLNTLENADIVVSGRFHHSLAAYCLGTPFIALNSNTPKMDGLMEMLVLPKALHYSDNDLLQQLITRTEKALDGNPQYPPITLNQLCELADINFRGVSAIEA